MKTNNDTGNKEIAHDENRKTEKLPDNDNADGQEDIHKAIEQKDEWDTLNRNGISPNEPGLDEDIINDIRKTEVNSHVKKRHPLHDSSANKEDIKWQEKDQQESDYEKQNDDDDNFAGGL